MNGTVSLGPFALRADLLVFLLAAVIGYAVLAVKVRRIEAADWIKETYVNVMGIGFLLWKFNLLFFEPLEAVANPLSLLYFSGGGRGLWLGMIGAFGYFLYRGYRNRPQLGPLIKAGVLAYGVVQAVRFALILLWEGEMSQESILSALLSAALFIAAWLKFDSPLNSFVKLGMWYSIGFAIIPFLNPHRSLMWIGFSLEQLLFVLLAVSLLIFDSLWRGDGN